MSFMNKVGGIFKMDEPDDGFYDDDDEFYDDEPEIKKTSKADTADGGETRRLPRVSAPKPNRKTMGNGMEVCVVKPTAFEDSREITETLLSNRTVVLNMEGLNIEIAQRIIDFASGSCYAIRGNLQKISNYIFIITPASVDVSGDFSALISGTLDVEISR